MVFSASVSAAQSARSEPPSASDALEDRARQQLLDDGARSARVSVHRETGSLRFLGVESGRVQAPRVAAADPEAAARSHLEAYAPLFGIHDQSAELAVEDVDRPGTRDEGASSVRFRQVVGGVPVLAGELAVQLDAGGGLVSASGETLADPQVELTPLVTAEQAQQTAVEAVAKGHQAEGAQLVASTPQRWIFNPVLIGGPGLDEDRLVWRMEVTTADPPIRQLVLVDAHRGGVALSIDQIQHAKNRSVCDNQNSSGAPIACTSPVRTEGGAASTVADVNLAYDLSGATYDYFLDQFGRDSIDGAGMAVRSTVRHCEPDFPCPYQNAFWNGEQMTFGAGLVVDDVVAHELAHGVTESEADLFYYYQSGAINESMSDVFGELFDQGNGTGNDAAANRWLVGEDLAPPPAGLGVLRNMANPPQFNHPDSMTSPLYRSSPGDAGGVHSNSGVGNKAAYLMADGGTFNGVTVAAIGAEKTAAVHYEALTTLLTSGSDYADLYDALRQACANLVASGTTMTAANCAQVANAVDATEMDADPITGSATHPAPVCPAGQVPTDLRATDFEAGVTGWAFDGFELDRRYSVVGEVSAYGRPRAFVDTDALTMTSSVTLPAGSNPYLRFEHAHGFEADRSDTYDGGVVEFSTDGGGTWSDLGPRIGDHGYNGTISSGDSNPLGGRPGFVADSYGYTASRAELSVLAGQAVRFRFRTGHDRVVAGPLGWVIDDVRVYTCGEPTFRLSVARAGSGLGSVTSDPAGIVCGAVCSASFPVETSVSMSAVPAAGSRFDGWSGACSGTGECTVTMDQARSVTATFTEVRFPLSVSKDGSGSVTSNPAGIGCGASCSASYVVGTSVALSAVPVDGWSFGGWSGACSGTGGCTVTMNQARSVTAAFTEDPDPEPSPDPTSPSPSPGPTTVSPSPGPTTTGPSPSPSPQATSPSPTTRPSPSPSISQVPPGPDPVAGAERISAGDPVVAAVTMSLQRFEEAGSASYAVLSRDDNFADSLAGAPLSAGGPLLYTATAALTPATMAELLRALPAGGTVYLLGGEAAVSPAVAGELAAAGFTPVRLAGGSRVETSVAVAGAVRELVGRGGGRVAVARAFGPPGSPTAAWADSVTGGGWAASEGVPILVTGTEEVHPAVAAFLVADAPSQTVVLGGSAAISDATFEQLPFPLRVAGAERAATAAAIAEQLWAPVGAQQPYLALNAFREDGWLFGLAAGGLAADLGAPLLVVGDTVPEPTRAQIAGCHPTLLLGDASIVAVVVMTELQQLSTSTC